MKNYDPFGLAPKSNRNPLKAALAVAPPSVPQASGRIGSLPKPKKKPMQPAPMPAPLSIPRGLPRIASLPTPSPVPQNPGMYEGPLPEPSPVPQGQPGHYDGPPQIKRKLMQLAGEDLNSFAARTAGDGDWTTWYEHGDGTVSPAQGGRVVGPRVSYAQAGLPSREQRPNYNLDQVYPTGGQPQERIMPLPVRGQTVYDGLPSFVNPGRVMQSDQLNVPQQVDPLAQQAGLLPGRPPIQASYAMPTQRPGYLPQGMQQAPMPQYAPGGVIDRGTQELMRQVMQKQLMDSLNSKPVQTGPGFADGAMQLMSGLMPGSARFLDSQIANRQNSRYRDAQLAQQQADNSRATVQQMLQGIAANDPLSIAAQNQLFNQQSDWQKNQIAGVNAGTNAFKAEDDANTWRAQLPSQQWVSQQGAINSLLGQQNQSDANRYNFLNLEAQRQARQAQAQQEQAQAEADRIQRWKIAQLQAQQNQNDLLFRERNSVRQYGADGSKAKTAEPVQIAKALQTQFFNKDNTPRMSDAAQLKPAMQAYLRNSGVPEEQIDSYLMPYANVLNTPPEVKDKPFDLIGALGTVNNTAHALGTTFDLLNGLAARSGGQPVAQAAPQPQHMPSKAEVEAWLRKQNKGGK